MVNPILPSVAEVDDFYVAFAPNPFCPEITRVLNDMYASNLTGIDDFFVANSDRSTLLPSADLRRVLIDKIVQQLIIPHADPSALSDDIFDASVPKPSPCPTTPTLASTKIVICTGLPRGSGISGGNTSFASG